MKTVLKISDGKKRFIGTKLDGEYICYILINNMAMFCSCSEIFNEANFKSNGVIYLDEKTYKAVKHPTWGMGTVIAE